MGIKRGHHREKRWICDLSDLSDRSGSLVAVEYSASALYKLYLCKQVDRRYRISSFGDRGGQRWAEVGRAVGG